MLSKYIQAQSNTIVFDNLDSYERLTEKNHSNKLTFGGKKTFYLYFNNYNQKDDIELSIKPNSDLQIFLLSESSKRTNINLKVKLAKNAKLTFFSNFIAKRETKIDVSRSFALGEAAELRLLNALLFKGQFDMNETVDLNAKSASVELDQLNIGAEEDFFRIDQDVRHNAKSTKSTINNSLISNNGSKLKYSVSGRIFKGNSGSSCSQLNRGVILKPEGYILAEPKLFIDEYDVEANHGAAIGQIDDEQLFYLLSRGLDESEAKSLIISGYTNPFVQKITDEKLQAYVIGQITRKIKEAKK